MELKLKRLTSDNAKILLKITISEYHLNNGENEKAKELLDQTASEIEKIDTLETSVYAKFYHVYSNFFKVKKKIKNKKIKKNKKK